MKNAWSLLFAATVVLLAPVRASANDLRFSLTLNADDRAAAGITRLDSDQVAVLDALVRRDTGRISNSPGSMSATDGEPAPPATFSQRLTADERRIAGLTTLSETELPKLDAFVERHQNARLARTLLGPMSLVSRPSRLKPDETKPERKIHGSFSLSYGWGKGGYSEKTGSMVLNYDDPEGRYSIMFGYTESHVKGPQVYRDPFYDPARGPLREGQPPFRP